VTGFAVLLRKELLESWRTRRLPVIAGLFLIIGIISPLTARYLPEIIALAVGDQLTIPVPDPTVADAVHQLQKNLGQFGALAAIVLAMGSVASEKDRGTAAFVLTKPATRAAFLAAKLIALGAVLAIGTALAATVAWAYTAVLFEPLPVGGWVALAGLTWLALMAWASITFLASTVTRSAAAAAGIGVAALLGLSLVSAIPGVGRFLPTGLDPGALALAAGRPLEKPEELATAVLGTIAIVVGCAVLAWMSFRRQEL
jgi:ABC-2 type transport system permease protein